MTRSIDEGCAEAHEAARDRLAREGLYLPETEHDSCGVGLIATIDHKPEAYAYAGDRDRLTRKEVLAKFGIDEGDM